MELLGEPGATASKPQEVQTAALRAWSVGENARRNAAEGGCPVTAVLLGRPWPIHLPARAAGGPLSFSRRPLVCGGG